MKKIFTLLSTAVFAVALNAEESRTLSLTNDAIFVESVSFISCYDNTNAYFRLFDLNDYAITGDFTITGVDAAGAFIGPGSYAQLAVYTYDGDRIDNIDTAILGDGDTGIYGIFTNSEPEYWDWFSFEILEPASAPITPD